MNSLETYQQDHCHAPANPLAMRYMETYRPGMDMVLMATMYPRIMHQYGAQMWKKRSPTRSNACRQKHH